MRKFRYVVCDVFTDVPLTGNQLAVYTDARDLTDGDMQAIAREMNFSETVFVLPPTVEDADARIRIFTPGNELPFAGHPTLGSAFVLGAPLQRVVIRLETLAGVVPVELEREGPRIVFGWMDQPLPPWAPVENADEILSAVGVERSGLPVERYDLGPGHVYIECGSASEVASLQPDWGALQRATPDGVNCFAPDDGLWKTRMFAPGHGVSEDPATGSAAGPLAVHLARHRRIGFGQTIEIKQGAEINRPSTLFAVAEGTPERLERVRVGGSAVTVARGELSLP